jgi:hypothetical protein
VSPAVPPAGLVQRRASSAAADRARRHPRHLEDPGGLLIGLDEHDRADGEVDLPAGSTLLLNTDGVDTRHRSISDGLARLRHHAAALTPRLADQPLDTLCDQLLDRLVPQAPTTSPCSPPASNTDPSLVTGQAIRQEPRTRTTRSRCRGFGR